MKRIMNRIIILTMFVLAFGCKDDSLDPFRLNELKKGSLLALRGDDGTAGNLDPDQNFFLKENVTGTETFSYVADFVSEDQSLLESVEVYARILTGPRTKVATVAGSSFVAPEAGKPRQGTVSVPLSAILTAVGKTAATAATLNRTDLIIESDIILTDGSTVPASAIINTGLFAAAAFFPAHALNYYAEASADFVPVATLKMAGEVVKSPAGAITRPVFPLKTGATDTVFATYDQDITNTPTFTYANQTVTSAPVGVTGTGVVKKSAKVFYEIVTANAGYTGAVIATVSGAQASTYGLPLTQVTKTQTVNVDNTQPIVTSSSTGTRVGRGQFVTITINFNERMSAKSANAIKATITDAGGKLKPVTNAVMAISSTGLSATLVYLPEEINPADPVSHGGLTLTYSGGADEAGNAVSGGVSTGGLTMDVGTPPAPVGTLAATYDLGTQIRWTWTQSTGGSNAGGSVTGTIYWVAVNTAHSLDAQTAAPTGVAFDADANATWTMATGVSNRAQGTITVTGGNSGTSGNLTTIFSAFTANRNFLDDHATASTLDDEILGMDIYAVFLSSTGNQSAITATPQVSPTVAGTPVKRGVIME